jgi:hypothetical protein
MSNEPAKKVTKNEKLDMIITDLVELKVRLAKLEVFCEDKLPDTAPKLEQIHQEMADFRLEFRDRFEKLESALKES